jgi:aldose 1-epimerase
MDIEKIIWNGLDAVKLETKNYEAIIVPSVGANLVRLYNKEKGVDILRTPQIDEIETFISRPQIFGVPILFPPNRIEDGTYNFGEKKYSFPITIPSQNNYHHGILKSQPFVITNTSITAEIVEVETTFTSDKSNDAIFVDFPHEFSCKITFTLSDLGMKHTATFTNESSLPMPLGVGYHTPIRIPFTADGIKSEYKLLLSVGKRWELSDRGLPTGKLLDLSAEESLLRSSGVTPTGKEIEWALTDEEMEIDGESFHGAVIIDTHKQIRVFYEVDNQFKHWTLWNNGGDVDYICPEPQTWAINAPNLALPTEITGFKVIESGKSWSGTTKLYIK